MSIVATPQGAMLRCAFQKLEGLVTTDGLWLNSTAESNPGEKFRVMAIAVGREGSLQTLRKQGHLIVADNLASCVRPLLTEEYSLSADGVRQDFLVAQKPIGNGPLRVELEVAGAKAEAAVGGAQLTLNASKRKLAYNRLHVTDTKGNTLAAKLEVIGETRLAILVEDANATYPVRIDPTFSDADWTSLGGTHGVNDTVWATAVDGAGNLYVGGAFTTAGDTNVSYIAKWDGTKWSPVGLGLNSSVDAMAVSGNDLYVGGAFTRATNANGSTITASCVAKWNGTTWSSLGVGLNSRVDALAVSGGNVYAGGVFNWATNTGGGTGVSVNKLAKWNGSTWSGFGTGVGGSGDVRALAVVGSELYVGGDFLTIGGSNINYIAKWNGSTWSKLGLGVDWVVDAFAVSGSDLYVGGFFSNAGGSSANYIAKWNGNTWSSLGGGLPNSVTSLAVIGNDIYAGGTFSFDLGGGNYANYIAKWNGSTWTNLGSGLNNTVFALATSGTNLYVGGWFSRLASGDNQNSANHVAKWDGNSWASLGAGVNNYVYALAVLGSDIYVGGDFYSAGGVSANRVAKWNGSAWSALGAGLSDRVNALIISGNDLYAGGAFTNAGGTSANYVAKWSGNVWSPLGTGLNSSVVALAVSGTNLFAGGYFTTAGGNSANRVAKWDGNAWSALGAGPAVNGSVNALAILGTNLYAGGANGSPSPVVMKWNGASWSGLGSGLSGFSVLGVESLAVAGGDLYVGGQIPTAGGLPANGVAKWNGTNWSVFGSGPGDARALAVVSNEIYAGGYVSGGIVKWDGTNWVTLGSGVGFVFPVVGALALSGGDLYVGGYFETAGGQPSRYLAKAKIGGSISNSPLFTAIVPNSFGTQVSLTYTSDTGVSYYLLSSTNLTTWQTNSTITATGALNSVTVNITKPYEFYRLRRLP